MSKKTKAKPSGKSLPPSSRSGRPSQGPKSSRGSSAPASGPRSSAPGISAAFLPSTDVLPAAESSVATLAKSAPLSTRAPKSAPASSKKQTLILPSDESALSVPPSSLVDEDFVESSFFTAPPAPRMSVVPPELEAELARPSLRVARLMSEEAQAARARYRRWVSYGLGVCVLFLGAALVASISRKDSDNAPAPPLPVVQPLPVAELSAEVVAAAQAPVVAAAPDAAVLRKRAERALEQGKKDEALSLSEGAVAASPEQAEGYLLLGAAYELLGDTVKARESYRRCAEVATRGPRGECQSLSRR